MKKRLICMLLCLVVALVPMLASCAEQSDEDKLAEINAAQAQGAHTLSMWIVSEQPVEESVRKDVLEAINELTETNYKVRMDITYLSAAEYYEKLKDALVAYSEVERDAITGNIQITEDGLYQQVYPALLEDQVDILYVGDLQDADGNLLMSGADMYEELIAAGHLAPVDKWFSGANVKTMYEYVPAVYFNAAKYNGVTYAVPNNNVIGEYTYMLLNKELMDRYSLNGHFLAGNIDGFYNTYVYQFLNMILADDANDGSVLPVDATYEECLALLAYYWTLDPANYTAESDTFSLFGALYEDLGKLSRGETVVGCESLLENEKFVSSFLKLNQYRLENDGFFRTEANASTAYEATAIKFREGTILDITMEDGVPYYYEGDVCYYALPVVYPVATEENVYDSMFAVCAYNTDERVQRCMEIIAYFNTDATMRNLLQYGVEGEHYNIIDDELVRTEKGEGYQMDLYKTGNVFVAYPEAWMSDTIWESFMEQNADATVSPMLGFDMGAYLESDGFAGTVALDTELVAYVSALNEQTLALLNACTTYDEFESLVNALSALLSTKQAPEKDENGNVIINVENAALLAFVTDENSVIGGDLEKLYTNLCAMTAATATDAGAEGVTVNHYSPYGVYYLWAQAGGFVPVSKK